MKKSFLRRNIREMYSKRHKVEIDYKPYKKQMWCRHSYMIPHTSYTPYMIEDLLLMYPNTQIRLTTCEKVFYLNHLD